MNQNLFGEKWPFNVARMVFQCEGEGNQTRQSQIQIINLVEMHSVPSPAVTQGRLRMERWVWSRGSGTPSVPEV